MDYHFKKRKEVKMNNQMILARIHSQLMYLIEDDESHDPALANYDFINWWVEELPF